MKAATRANAGDTWASERERERERERESCIRKHGVRACVRACVRPWSEGCVSWAVREAGREVIALSSATHGPWPKVGLERGFRGEGGGKGFVWAQCGCRMFHRVVGYYVMCGSFRKHRSYASW